eukprot:TRINITY_DN3300_c0_g1_i1.p1 TRINITY_DN3300_c0_g1~~TRINITY_DN3300_c0_g1_i1.p1  ORF type:complete len:173 (+),score=41.51 TRINITY_DN3300_c0_g1_i1:78-596(+)
MSTKPALTQSPAVDPGRPARGLRRLCRARLSTVAVIAPLVASLCRLSNVAGPNLQRDRMVAFAGGWATTSCLQQQHHQKQSLVWRRAAPETAPVQQVAAAGATGQGVDPFDLFFLVGLVIGLASWANTFMQGYEDKEEENKKKLLRVLAADDDDDDDDKTKKKRKKTRNEVI